VDPRVEILRVGREGHPVLILDDLLTGAERLVDFAAETAVLAPVKAAANFYPGVRAPAPPGYVQALVTALRPIWRRRSAWPPDGKAHVTCALSMATLPADQASLAQRLPHIDTTAPSQLAILHYLCGPPHGGTAFYRHRATGFEAIDPGPAQAYLAALRGEMAAGPRRDERLCRRLPRPVRADRRGRAGLQPDRGLRQQPAARRGAGRPARRQCRPAPGPPDSQHLLPPEIAV
jgi:hypothetical protein